ncbi:MAG: DNA methylase [Anaerovoracaceae bacterium]
MNKGKNTSEKRKHTYLCIDLKSFYASVDCSERGRDPLTTNLVVADESRTSKTICLAVSPSLKSLGVPGRPRLFEVIRDVRMINADRLSKAPGHVFSGSSDDITELTRDPSLSLSYIVAPPRMSFYIKYSTDIYKIYLKYVAPEDIQVYSIDEVFIDLTDYIGTYGMSAHDIAMMMIRDVLKNTGITATCGIGSNLYLAKIAMDIEAKHKPADKDGVRIAELDEMTYRRSLWTHTPITDFWRVGRGYADKLAANGMYTMGDVARCSVGAPGSFYNEDLLYRLFGINAELLIDHAWGWEPCTLKDIKSYRPERNSISDGQVLQAPYENAQAKIVTMEMADHIALDLVSKKMTTDQIVLDIKYDSANIDEPARMKKSVRSLKKDIYGRLVPAPAHGSENLGAHTSSSKVINDAVSGLFDRITDKDLLIRKIYVTANNVISEDEAAEEKQTEQLDFFSNLEQDDDGESKAPPREDTDRERKAQEAILSIKDKFGKNSIFKGRDLEEGATAMQRNDQIGGHKA